MAGYNQGVTLLVEGVMWLFSFLLRSGNFVHSIENVGIECRVTMEVSCGTLLLLLKQLFQQTLLRNMVQLLRKHMTT